jgi:membrane-bound lytic murein transglycosylase D
MMKTLTRLVPLPLLLAAACSSGGPRESPPAGPVPSPVAESAGTAANPATPPLPGDSEAIRSESDTSLPLSEEIEELQHAADSIADAEVLEQLENTVAADFDSSSADSEEAAAGVERVTWDIDVTTFTNHDRVQYFLDFFQGPARPRMTIWLERMQRYEDMIRAELAGQELPGDLVYLALIESGFSNTAVSRARATGMWQFMRGTARMYGLRMDSWVDERRDPFKATAAAARHLRDLRDRFGSIYLAAAAYNAGGGKVSRGLARLPEDEEDSLNSDATFFRLSDTRHLRQETRDYVPKLIAAALIAKEPTRYGFPTFEDVHPPVWDSMIVTDATGLDVIARLADTTVVAIREMNPQYLRLSTPPGSRSLIRLPAGRGERVSLAYAELPASKRVTFQEHYVTRGQTLSHIAGMYRVSVSDLRDANPSAGRILRIGQRLIVPTGGVVVAREAAAAEDRRAEIRRSVSSTHRVRSGETLSEIAERYHVTVAQIKAWNGLRGSTIRVGQRLRIGTSSSARVSSGGGSIHIVRPGDTISGVAQRYGVSQSALRAANGLGSSSMIRAGSRLKIPG